MKGLLNACVVSTTFISASCNLINPEEDLPAYIHIPAIALSADYLSQGSASHKITDAWVYADGELQGIYELPCRFPLLRSGNVSIRIRAGIWNNGISSVHTAYPFYQPYETVITADELATDTLSPQVVYYPDSVLSFAWLEDFEVGSSVMRLPTSDTTIIPYDQGSGSVCEGARSAAVYLDAERSGFLGVSASSFSFSKFNEGTYLELNYSCNNAFEVGVMSTQGGLISTQYKVTVSPKPYWNKIYVELTDLMPSSSSAIYQVAFRAEKADSIANGYILLDNIKLIHYK